MTCEILSAISSGLLSILLSFGVAMFVWWLTTKRPTPRIKMGEYIAIKKTEIHSSQTKGETKHDRYNVQTQEGRTIYHAERLLPKRTIISENGRRYQIMYSLRLVNITAQNLWEKMVKPGNEAYNICTYIKIFYKGHYFQIKTPEIPVLSNIKLKKSDKLEKSDTSKTARNILFDFDAIPEHKIESILEENDIVRKHYQDGTLMLEDFLNDDKVNFEVVVTASGPQGTTFREMLMQHNHNQLKEFIQEGEYNDKDDPLKFTPKTNYVGNELL